MIESGIVRPFTEVLNLSHIHINSCGSHINLQESDDEDEQRRVADKAQLLMDCISDMIQHEGMDGMKQMVQNGIRLHPLEDPSVVRGEMNAEGRISKALC